MAAEVRAFVAAADRRGLELEPSDKSKTGFVNVIEVKGKFQARLQVPGDGRGCSKKRKQHPLAGAFDSAEEAAVNLELFKKALSWALSFDKKEVGESVASPPKQNKKHKPRQEKQPAAPVAAPPPVELSMALAPPTAVMGVPIPFVMQHVPLVAARASPLPTQPLGYTPPFGMRS